MMKLPPLLGARMMKDTEMSALGENRNQCENSIGRAEADKK